VIALLLPIVFKISASFLLQSEVSNVCERVPKIVLLLAASDGADHSSGK